MSRALTCFFIFAVLLAEDAIYKRRNKPRAQNEKNS